MSRIAFNYDLLKDAEARKAARDGAHIIHGLLVRTGANVIEIGRNLVAVRQRLGSATFSAWLRCEFGWNQPFASLHMRAAQAFGDADGLERFQPTALYVLSRKNVPEEAVREALDLARAGETVTHKRAVEICQRRAVPAARSDAGVPRRKPSATPAAAMTAAASDGGLADLQKTLDGFTANLDRIARTLTPDARRALSERFLDLALKLRAAAEAAPTAPEPARPRKRRPAAA